MLILETLTYIGRNRRSEKCVIESLFELAPDEWEAISEGAENYCGQLESVLQANKILFDTHAPTCDSLAVDAAGFFAFLYAETALAIQRFAGHKVSFSVTVNDPKPNRKRVAFEYEQADVGHRAGLLALGLLSSVIPELNWIDQPPDQSGNFSKLLAEFKQFANALVLPADAQAIIDAASRLDIPCVKLEREPYQGVTGEFRIRKNGLLKLGHSVYQHIVDGTFCIDMGAHFFSLIGDRDRKFQFLAQLQVPVKKYIDGDTFKVIMANKDIVGVVSMKDNRDVLTGTHPSTCDLALGLANKLDVGLFVVDVVTSDIGQPLHQNGGAVVDVDLAPELDRFLPAGSDMHMRAMSGFVKWLFPGEARSRIPTVAVTGTNGKTTTCRMIMNIMQAGHFHTGFACTDGIYINNKLVEVGDQAGRGGHHRIFESREVNLGILETARGALAHSGLMFDWCNVSVCLNVTEDHLEEYGIETVDQMAKLKRSVLESAREGAVLFADNDLCIDMLSYIVAPRICLVSVQSRVEELAKIPGNKACFGILESVNGSDWLVLYDKDQRMPVIEVEQIPAAFGGAARFNVCNALHAVAASYLMGMDIDTVRKGLQTFNMSFENTPGRLNFYDVHPFRVLMDFAHNKDGMHQLCEFIERIEISGRKLLMFQARGDIEDKYVRDIATAAAGHFDHYVCRTHPLFPGTEEHKMPAILKDALLDAGVGDQQVTVTTDPMFAVDTMLNMGKEGDLLVFTPGSGQPRTDTWERVKSFNSETSGPG